MQLGAGMFPLWASAGAEIRYGKLVAWWLRQEHVAKRRTREISQLVGSCSVNDARFLPFGDMLSRNINSLGDLIRRKLCALTHPTQHFRGKRHLIVIMTRHKVIIGARCAMCVVCDCIHL